VFFLWMKSCPGFSHFIGDLCNIDSRLLKACCHIETKVDSPFFTFKISNNLCPFFDRNKISRLLITLLHEILKNTGFRNLFDRVFRLRMDFNLQGFFCILRCLDSLYADAVPVLQLLFFALVPSGDIGVVACDPAPPPDFGASAARTRIK